MGQKVNPIANRLGIIRGWDSNWYGGKDFSSKLVEDAKIRKYLNARLLKEELRKLTGKEIQINIFEVKRPEIDAVIVGNNIARQLEGRISYRRAIKTAIASTMRMGAEGIKIQISGRVGGAEMARNETYKEGRIPLHTFRADVDYALSEALTKVGLLGIKVWICNGEVYDKRDLFQISGVNAQASAGNQQGGGYRGDKPRGGRDNKKRKNNK